MKMIGNYAILFFTLQVLVSYPAQPSENAMVQIPRASLIPNNERFLVRGIVDSALKSIESDQARESAGKIVHEGSKRITEPNRESAKKLVEEVNLQQKKLSPKELGIEVKGGKLADKDGVNIGELLSRYNVKDALESESDKFPGLMVLISLGMPENTLKQLAIQVKKANGIFVLRGMYQGSLTKTVKAIYELNKQGVSAIIHPEFFKKYDVKVVPTFVLEDKENKTCKLDNCTRIYDKLAGNVSLNYVLKEIEGSGNNKTIAKKYLKLLESNA